jgi:hypothetical protein
MFEDLADGVEELVVGLNSESRYRDCGEVHHQLIDAVDGLARELYSECRSARYLVQYLPQHPSTIPLFEDLSAFALTDVNYFSLLHHPLLHSPGL